MVAQTYNPSSCEEEAGQPGVQDRPWLQRKFEANKDYMEL